MMSRPLTTTASRLRGRATAVAGIRHGSRPLWSTSVRTNQSHQQSRSSTSLTSGSASTDRLDAPQPIGLGPLSATPNPPPTSDRGGSSRSAALNTRGSLAMGGGVDRLVRLVVFDKDGTLVCFNSLWLPWASALSKRLEAIVGRPIRQELYRILGVCPQTERVLPGLLAEASMREIAERLAITLAPLASVGSSGERIGVTWRIYESVLTHLNSGRGSRERTLSRDEGTPSPSTSVAPEASAVLKRSGSKIEPLADLPRLFSALRSAGHLLAVSTSDARANTLPQLRALGVEALLHHVQCSDDAGVEPKPDARNVLRLCSLLNVDPRETAIVGDTPADLRMGRSAKLALCVGVLSGVGRERELAPLADLLLPSVGHLLPHLVPNSQQIQTTANKTGPTATQQAQLQYKEKSRRLSPVRFSVASRASSRPAAPEASRQRQPNEFDYLIVGGGSAGCVLANRLSADSGRSVCLLEAGARDRSWTFHMPAALMQNFNSERYNWRYQTVPQAHLQQRCVYWPRGKVWGGSSSINGMVFVRGHRRDFERWASEELCTGWSYADVLPYFKRLETLHADPTSKTSNSESADARGSSGPLEITNASITNRLWSHIPFHQLFIEAGRSAGMRYNPDFNSGDQEGVGWYDLTIANGLRQSASRAFLRPALSRANIRVESLCHVTRLLFNPSLSRAIGIECLQRGKLRKLYAKEVILSAGAINSPQLLLLSGIGDADALRKLGIAPVLHLPAVGANLQDHLEFYVQYGWNRPEETLATAQWTESPMTMTRIGLEWFLWHGGLGGSNHLEAGAFLRSHDSVPHPNVQIHTFPAALQVNESGALKIVPGVQLHIGTLRATSRGSLRLQTANPFDKPLIDPNYLATREDRSEMLACVRMARDLFGQRAFGDRLGSELQPGADLTSDRDLMAFIEKRSESAFHPCGTCRMGDPSRDLRGAGDRLVVDSRTMRVRGIEGLRVVDASVMPSETSGNLNAPTLMIAEKASDMILSQDLI